MKQYAVIAILLLFSALLSGCVNMQGMQETGAGSGECAVGGSTECGVPLGAAGQGPALVQEQSGDEAGSTALPEAGADLNAGVAAGESAKGQFFSSPVVQEIADMLIPSGTPSYGNGTISFDKPDKSLKFFESVDGYKGKIESENLIILEGDGLYRYNNVAPKMTCEYCCGPAAIEDCGCNHAAAYRGIAKYLIKYHGSEFSDEEIVAEQVKWKNLWFQQGAVVKELRLQNNEGEISDEDLNKLLGMVGSC